MDQPPATAPALLIAVVGCDGAGKSTLTADLARELGRMRPVAVCYLGLGSGDLGRRIKGLPLAGPPLERLLAGKAKRARRAGERMPGPVTALVIFGFSLMRLRRFRRMERLLARGVTVLTDRYPQTEVAGLHDGPGLSAARAGGPFVRRLAARERRMYEAMAERRPDLVIRLDIDAATALARKPDHKPDLLRDKVDAIPLLRFNGARTTALDARAPYAEVRARAVEAVRSVLGTVA